jgi:hypothetical protein
MARKKKTDKKIDKKIKNQVKANSRGYAFLGKIEGCPDLSKVKVADIDYADNGTVTAHLGRGKVDAGQMLRRGYLHIGANETKKVTFSKNLIKVQ